MKEISREEAMNMVLSIPHEENKIFSVTFVKRTNGETRHMVCRRNVKKHLKGGELRYSAKSKNLLPVFDVQKREYRMINCETITQVKIEGETYNVI